MTADDDLRAEIARIFDQARDRALALVAEKAGDDVYRPEWVSLKEAAFQCDGCHVETMARRAERFGLGRRLNRVWQIDMRRVRAWQEGQPYEPIPKMSEDAASPDAKCGNGRDASDDTSAAS